MTRQEAIKGLKVLRRDFSGYKPNEEMFDIAIQALEQEPCDDCISRQAAIEALDQDVMGGLNYRRILRLLPSADRWR